jgi:hypothetical protein
MSTLSEPADQTPTPERSAFGPVPWVPGSGATITVRELITELAQVERDRRNTASLEEQADGTALSPDFMALVLRERSIAAALRARRLRDRRWRAGWSVDD